MLQEQLRTKFGCSPQQPWHNAYIGPYQPGTKLWDQRQILLRQNVLQSHGLLQLPYFIKGEEESKVWGDHKKSLRAASLEILTRHPHKALVLHQVLQYLTFQYLFAVGLGAWMGIDNDLIKSD